MVTVWPHLAPPTRMLNFMNDAVITREPQLQALALTKELGQNSSHPGTARLLASSTMEPTWKTALSTSNLW